jgi:prolyl-tRNA synthetase
LRNVPLGQSGTAGECLFTGKPGVEEILISRAY